MTERADICEDELAILKARVKKLALEKSYLQLSFTMMERLHIVSGLEDLARRILYIVNEHAGGTYSVLYYFADSDIFITDMRRKNEKVTEIDDALIARVLETGTLAEERIDDGKTLMLGMKKTLQPWTWAAPFCVGDEIVGVVKVERTLLNHEMVRVQLQPFFNYAALILRNEIRGYRKLEQAYGQLKTRNNTLENEIQERMRVEKELAKAKEAAEAASQTKSLFLANMSHELRTPLNAVIGFSEMIGRDRDISASIQEKIAIVNRSGEHLLGMINDILDLSKIEAGRVELQAKAFDLVQMLEDIGRLFELRAETAGLRFEIKTAPNMTPYIKTDIGKLRQILINLLGNAVKFTGEGGVVLRARTKSIPDNANMVSLQLEVEDSGPGITQEAQQLIFKPFVQVENLSNTGKGTGLGLSITKSFVELLDGEIWIESEIGKGTIFHLELPVVPVRAAESVATETVRLAMTGLEPGQPPWRIMTVEDNPDNRLLLSSLLAQTGFLVREAENGKEALTLFAEWQPHFIWMDMRMPVMNGYEATRRIRGLPGGDRVKIVALTASVLKEQHGKILAAGCDAVLHKPFRTAELFSVMEKFLGVRYLFEKSQEDDVGKSAITVTTAMFGKLPAAQREALSKAARKLDITATEEVAEKIRADHPEVTECLQQLLREFRFSRILELLNTGKE